MQNRASILHAVVRRRFIPIPPAFALDMSPQPTIDQRSLRPFAPRTAQVDRIRRHAIRCCKRTTVEHKSVRLAFRRGGCRYIPVDIHIAVERADLAPLKVGTRAAKDKVDIALDPATSKILAPHPARRILFGPYEPTRFSLMRRQRAQKQCVLAPLNAAGIDNQTVTIGIQGNRLTDLAPIARIVFDREVCKRHVIGIDQHRISAEGAELSVLAAAVLRGHLRRKAANDTHAVGRLSLNRHMRATNLDPFAVLTRLDMDCHRPSVIRTGFVNCLQGLRDTVICPRTLERNLKKSSLTHHQSPRPFVVDRLRCSFGI